MRIGSKNILVQKKLPEPIMKHFGGQNVKTDDACPDTHHIKRHDYHEVDADASARRSKLPVLLDKVPVEGGKLLHCDETENYNSKHGR